MDSVVIAALIGLAGSLVAGSAFSDWLKRRNLHESIKADLEVWSALPDGAVKAHLLQKIQVRAQELPFGLRPSAARRVAAFLGPASVYVVAFFVVNSITTGATFHRDSDGILRWYPTPGHPSVTFLEFVLWVPWVLIVPGIVGMVLDLLYEKLTGRKAP